MNDIASRTAGPDINEFLKNQKTGRVLPDVESANDGSERGLPNRRRTGCRGGSRLRRVIAPMSHM